MEVVGKDEKLLQGLQALASKQVVVFLGLPGVGKSLTTNALAHIASNQGREVTLLMWDVSGAAFKYMCPNQRVVAGNSDDELVVRHAAGLWARAMVAKWAARNSGGILIVEAPLVDGRFIELVKPGTHGEEVLQDQQRTVCAVVVPSREVRDAIVALRTHRMQNPVHPNEKEDCPVEMIHEYWETLHQAAVATGLATPHAAGSPTPFDPSVYAAMFQSLCHNRASVLLHMDKVLDTSGFTPYNYQAPVTKLTPTQQEVDEFVAMARAQFNRDNALRWYESAR